MTMSKVSNFKISGTRPRWLFVERWILLVLLTCGILSNHIPDYFGIEVELYSAFIVFAIFCRVLVLCERIYCLTDGKDMARLFATWGLVVVSPSLFVIVVNVSQLVWKLVMSAAPFY